MARRTRVYFYREPVTVVGPVVFDIIGHSLTLRNDNNLHDLVVDLMNGRINGAWAPNEDNLQGPHR